MTSSEVQKLEIIITTLKVAVELEHQQTRNKLDDLGKALSLKANKWIEKVGIAGITAIILYFLGGLLGLFKIIPVSVAFNNVLTLMT